MTRLFAECVAVPELSRVDLWSMCALLDRNFEGVTRAGFERDLENKDHALLLRDEGGTLRGFTTLAITHHPARDLYVLHSGDTIVERSHWGSLSLASQWIGAVRALRDELQGKRLLWLLICSGPRTYRFLPVFFRRFVPHHTGSPALARNLLHELAHARYGDGFDHRTGLVHLTEPQRLRPEIRDLPGVRRDKHVDLFHTLNPNADEGDELACLADLSDDNLTRAGWRMVRAFERDAMQVPQKAVAT